MIIWTSLKSKTSALQGYCQENEKTSQRLGKKKMVSKDISNKGLLSKIYTVLLKLNKVKNAIKKWEKNLNRYLIKGK